MNKRFFRRRTASGHLEVILAIIIAVMGAVWYIQSSSSAKKQMSAYYTSPPYTAAQSPQTLSSDSLSSGKINKGLVFLSAGLIYVIGIMTGLFFPLLHSIKHKHRTVPFAISHLLPTKANRVMDSLDSLQKMRDSGLISKPEFESKRLELLSKL